MYARRPSRPKPRMSQAKKWVAPVSGWVANRALADPSSIEGPGAAILDNFFPRSTSVVLRRGNQRFATLENAELPVSALFAYRTGAVERLFAANESTIYDVTDVIFPVDVILETEGGLEIETEAGDVFGWGSTLGYSVAGGFTGGDWITAQFATTGGVYLIGVNGVDPGFLYDGTAFYPHVAGGVTRLNYDGETDPLAEGDTVTGGTSGATATIWRVVPGAVINEGYLLLIDVAGTFVDDEALTDGGTGAAVANGVPELVAPSIVFGDGSLTSADMAYVWVYKNRLFFAQTDSMNAWYMVDVDSIGGNVDVFPLSGIFGQGGSLMFGSAWSLDSSGDSGLSEQCVMVSNQGEVAVFQGSDPGGVLGTWVKAGLYRIGKPLGRKAFMRGGGDLAIATSVGLVPLSKAIALDITALNVASVSYKIADAWGDAVTLRGGNRWQCQIWPEGKMAVVAPPDVVGSSDPVMFVSNTETGAWARFTGWEALCMETFRGQLFFGSTQGRLFIANVGGNDDGATYSGAVMPLYEDMGSASSLKVAKLARARGKSNVAVNDKVDTRIDFDMNVPNAPDATTLSASNTWGTGIWDQTIWGGSNATVINQQWRSVSGLGYSMSVVYQVTSGSIAPIDAELIDIEMLFETAELVT